MIETSGVIEKEQGNGFYLVTLEQPEGHQCLCSCLLYTSDAADE